MKNTPGESDKKEHADFQDQYRRSSNFSQLNEDETEELAIEGDGEVNLKKGKNEEQSDKERIKDVMKQLETDEEE